VSDRAKKTERDARCPRCGTTMDEVANIGPSLGDPGLVAYECPKCAYVTSKLVQPNGPD